MNISEFYQLTPREFAFALDDNRSEQNGQLEIVLQTMWETTRTLILHIYRQNPHVKRKPKKATDVFRFAWDKIQEKKPQSFDEMKSEMSRIVSIFNSKKTRKK